MLNWKYRPREQSGADSVQTENETAIPDVKPEGFASRNVKVITFAVCIAVFLLLFGPVNIFYLSRMSHVEKVGSAKMTESDIRRLSALGEKLTMSDLKRFEGSFSENDRSAIYTVQFDHYLLYAVEDTETGRIVVCLLTDASTEESVNVLSGDVSAFLDGHRESGQEKNN